MRYLRLFSVVFFLTFTITGCHRKQVRSVPPPQAQAPIVSTLPPMPPLTFPNVDQGQPKPTPKPAPTAPPPKPKKKTPAHGKIHHRVHKREPENKEPSAPAPSEKQAGPIGAAVLGQLSADDTTVNPDQKAQIKKLIAATQNRLDKLSNSQKEKHKEDIAQVESFLQQAEQAWNMNDLVGSQTLANKAKILMDELLK